MITNLGSLSSCLVFGYHLDEMTARRNATRPPLEPNVLLINPSIGRPIRPGHYATLLINLQLKRAAVVVAAGVSQCVLKSFLVVDDDDVERITSLASMCGDLCLSHTNGKKLGYDGYY